MIVILNYDEQLTIRTIVNITKNSITLSKINTNNEKEKVSKDYLTNSIYAIVEKSINLKIFSKNIQKQNHRISFLFFDALYNFGLSILTITSLIISKYLSNSSSSILISIISI